MISGHNTPLPSLQKTREKYLTQINKDQDDLLQQLKKKQTLLEFGSMNASRLLETFRTKMKQPDLFLPDRQKTEAVIHGAFRDFHRTKLKPLHSTRSFSQRRSEIEKHLELGYSFKKVRSTSR